MRRAKAVDDPDSSVSDQSQKTSGKAPIQEAPPPNPGNAGQPETHLEAIQVPATLPSDADQSEKATAGSPPETKPDPGSVEPAGEPQQNLNVEQHSATTAAEEAEEETQGLDSLMDSGLDAETGSPTGLEEVQFIPEDPEPGKDPNGPTAAEASDFEYITSLEVRGIKPERDGADPNSRNRSSKAPRIRSAGIETPQKVQKGSS